MTTIGSRLKQIRTEKHLTQVELGELIGVSKQAIANVEGCHSNPSIEFMSKLIENLNVNSNWFITGKGSMFNPPEFEDVKTEILSEVNRMLAERGL
ncbi:MAG: helix-turn-helix transcriptional regulator [bacterium]|nr:helix-turn-helix transcriptional regulator [bacterium]